MPRSLRQSTFRRKEDMGEDINPSAYIVNLADCMLVLACGFMVAMIVYWNIDISHVTELTNETMEQVDPQELIDNIQGEGSNYVEAGTVYQDPTTGQLWMVRTDEGDQGATGAETGEATAPSVPEGSLASGASAGASREMGAD